MTDITSLLSRLAPWPKTDFSEFGAVEVKPLSRYQKLVGAFLGRNWVAIPHVTHNDDLDITDLEARRGAWNQRHPQQKITVLTLVMKALVAGLKTYPEFNASLTEDGASLVFKQYYNIGVAVDTPAGLLVPTIRDCDGKPLGEIAAEVSRLAEKARSKGLTMAEMSGSSICVSSLGHIGGTSFTPIINAPDVAILGLTRNREVAARGPDGGVIWRIMLPVSLSYDHRVINGAVAARFVKQLGETLGDPAIFE